MRTYSMNQYTMIYWMCANLVHIAVHVLVDDDDDDDDADVVVAWEQKLRAGDDGSAACLIISRADGLTKLLILFNFLENMKRD